MPEYRLTEEIISLSAAKKWSEAKLEWELHEVYHQTEPDTCLCGHFPINEICILRNKRNRNHAMVGNVCVTKFLGLPSERIFEAVRKVAKAEEKALNAETIDHARRKGWIGRWEYDFYVDTIRKRVMTAKQMAKRVEVNRKVLQRIKRG